MTASHPRAIDEGDDPKPSWFRYEAHKFLREGMGL
jgi:hypothetical protein